MAPGMTINMSLQMALSPEGSSKSFDAAADGYARGEAVNALYIKRLDEAIRDGNPIRAVLRGSATNALVSILFCCLINFLFHTVLVESKAMFDLKSTNFFCLFVFYIIICILNVKVFK